MAIEKPAPWSGASGTEYAFYVFGLEPDVPGRQGLYIYAKRNAEGAWVPIYMGQGDVARCCEDPNRRRCIAAKAATHIHLRLKSDEADRETELADLLAHYANAFAPEGCHPAATAETPAPRKTTRRAKPPAPSRKPAAKVATKKAMTKKATTKKAVARKTVPKTTPKTRKSPVKAKSKGPRPRSR